MSQQQISSNEPSTQKVVADNKQGTVIRKITLQTLRPVVSKIEEHVTYLLDETSKLRNQNACLEAAVSNQKRLEQEISRIYEKMEEMTIKINANYKQSQMKNQQRRLQITNTDYKVQNLTRQAAEQHKRIDEIKGLNESYMQQIGKNKEEQIEKIQELKISIEKYYQQEMYKIKMAMEQNDITRERVIVLEEKRLEDYEEIKKINNVITLFEEEKEEVQKLIDKITFLENNIVMIGQYRKDKKVQKAENQMVKESVRKMIDQALTPQIRKFLPILIKKLDELNAFQNRLTLIVKKIEQNKKEHEVNLNQLDNKYQKEVDLINEFINELFFKSISEIQNKLLAQIEQVRQRISINNSAQKSSQEILNEKLKQIAEQASKALRQATSQLERDIKIYIEQWGDSFLDKKKEAIYQVVVNEKPKEQNQKYEKIITIVEQMEPILTKVQHQIEKTDQSLNITEKKVDEKLVVFGHQISKMKSNIAIQKTDTKRMLDLFQAKLQNSHKFIEELAHYSSKLTESMLMDVCLQLQAKDDHEVFVTYNDGLVFEFNDGVGTYRRKNLKASLARRALLQVMIKEIDYIVINLGEFGWDKSENKPSAFFSKVYEQYLGMFEQGTERMTIRQQQLFPLTPIKSKGIEKNEGLFSEGRMKANRDVLSRTIDLTSNQFRSYESVTKHNPDKQYSNRRSIKLAKITKQEV